MLPLFLYLAKKEVITYARVVSLLCKNPADLLSIPKGSINIGNDADFIVVNLKNETRIKSFNLHYKCGWSIFDGWKAIFPSSLFIRGERVVGNNEILIKKGYGKFVGD